MSAPSSLLPFRYFDPEADCLVTVREHLPHWAQSGTVSFLTWRTWDSMPREAIEKLLADRDAWLSRHGIDPAGPDWRQRAERLPAAERQEFHRHYSARWEALLDECHGECPLRRPELARVVADSLRAFDGDRYTLSDFVVMPNHVHVLAVFADPALVLKQCYAWKHFTAGKINKALQRRGNFWQADGFDHLVRSAEQFEYLRQYVADNPRRAGMRDGEYVHYSRVL